jgi:oxalate decarboxylase/phosphoglucose isomerase-like protein (cupin superfamily)
MPDVATDDKTRVFLHDNYLEWCDDQGVPIIQDFGIDLMKIDVGPWDLYGMHGAVCLLKGRDDFNSIFCFELPPGSKSRPMQHIYEDVIFVMEGYGSTTIETADGQKHSFEWGRNSLFAVPINSRYQHFNGSGQEPARFASVHNFPFLINLFRNEEFIFNNPITFPERLGPNGYFTGDGQMIEMRPGSHQWETNFVADITNFELKSWAARGKGSSSLRWILSDSTMGCHTSQIVTGTYKKAHRHMCGTNVFTIDGEGYSLLWYEGKEDEIVRVDWDHGVVVTPPEQMFHQHFNTGTTPSRYLALQFGTVRYPMTWAKKDIWSGKVDKSVEDGGAQIEYENQMPQIHKIWLGEMDRKGIPSEMGEIFDEEKSRAGN